MWRWSRYVLDVKPSTAVFSTYVEVIPHVHHNHEKRPCILHVCGGDPKEVAEHQGALLYSPRMWRWSYSICHIGLRYPVFSTYVEVILNSTLITNFNNSILHVCGGDPRRRLNSHLQWLYSPRMWRWSSFQVNIAFVLYVFSTYVEVILTMSCNSVIFLGILHVCGGDPQW